MSPVEYVAQKYSRDTDWASRFITFAELMLRYDDVLQVHCEASRDYWARQACSVASCNAPDYAYLRGKSDAYQELQTQFRNFARDLNAEYEQFTRDKEETPWQ